MCDRTLLMPEGANKKIFLRIKDSFQEKIKFNFIILSYDRFRLEIDLLFLKNGTYK